VAPERVDVVVIGAGAMGSATAWWLARRGHDVVLLEQFEQGHNRGSSHGATRIFRFAYSDPVYVRMAMDALPLWRELEAEANTTLVETTGAVDHGDPATIQAIADALDANSAAYELLDARQAEARWPHMRFDRAVIHHHDGGRCLADRAVRTLQDRAAAHGAQLSFGGGAARIDDGTTVRNEHGEWSAKTVVVTAGAWLPQTLPELASRRGFRVTREHVQHFAPANASEEEARHWPSFIHHRAPWCYGLYSTGEGMKVAEHQAGPEADPDIADQSTAPKLLDRAIAYVDVWFPGLDPTPRATARCLYTSTTNEDFVIDRVDGIVIGSPCSGHGFKFTPLIGRLLADLAEGAGGPGGRFALSPGG